MLCEECKSVNCIAKDSEGLCQLCKFNHATYDDERCEECRSVGNMICHFEVGESEDRG